MDCLSYYPTTARLSQQAKDRLRDLDLEGVGDLWAFHITKRERLWCIRRGETYSALWWDPRHKVYPRSSSFAP